MNFQLIASVIRGFPGTDPLGEGWPEIWTDQPNRLTKLLSAGFNGPGHDLGYSILRPVLRGLQRLCR